jgi:hypothetical protein
MENRKKRQLTSMMSLQATFIIFELMRLVGIIVHGFVSVLPEL